jgi:hypothetical protein
MSYYLVVEIVRKGIGLILKLPITHKFYKKILCSVTLFKDKADVGNKNPNKSRF